MSHTDQMGHGIVREGSRSAEHAVSTFLLNGLISLAIDKPRGIDRLED